MGPCARRRLEPLLPLTGTWLPSQTGLAPHAGPHATPQPKPKPKPNPSLTLTRFEDDEDEIPGRSGTTPP